MYLFPGINIAGSISPPFRELSEEEDASVVAKINKADPDILFVSLGAPKQERWMAAHKGRIKAVQLGVGAAGAGAGVPGGDEEARCLVVALRMRKEMGDSWYR